MVYFIWRTERDIASLRFAPPLAHCPKSKLSDNFTALRRTLRRSNHMLIYRNHPTKRTGDFYGGQRGIRTLGTREGSLVFETSQFNHSCTCPCVFILSRQSRGGRPDTISLHFVSLLRLLKKKIAFGCFLFCAALRRTYFCSRKSHVQIVNGVKPKKKE